MRQINYKIKFSNAELLRLPYGVRNAIKDMRNRLNITAQRLDGGAVVYTACLKCDSGKVYAVSAVGLEDVKERFITNANAL